ncbi:hypothetical protein N9N97_03225 [Rickettsiaceae bacterium]|nr:hypothetical protein [Rickettsiaceae bacterium]
MAMIGGNKRVNQLADSITSDPNRKAGKSSGITKDQSAFFEKMNKPVKKSQSSYEEMQEKMKKAVTAIDKAMDFSMKLMISSAKNMGLPGGDDGSKMKEMSDNARSVAEMMATKASIQAQMLNIESQQNVPVDLMNLKGKMVDYDNSTQNFNGTDKVEFTYKVSHSNPSPDSKINITFNVLNENGKTVSSNRVLGQTGEHTYEWNGRDNFGKKLSKGKYTLDIRAQGSNANGTTFHVDANATLSGVVESVKMEGGVVTGVVIDGKTITRDMISNIRDIEKPKPRIEPNSELIGKHVDLDFSTAEATTDGKMVVYFKNHIENSGEMKIQVFDENNKFIKDFKQNDEIGVGSGKITLDKTDLEPGRYNIKVFVEDVTNPDQPKKTELKYNHNVLVNSVNPGNNSFATPDSDEFNAGNIVAVSGNIDSTIEKKRAQYSGANVLYKNNKFNFDAQEEVKYKFTQPEADGIIHHGRMTIYSQETKELVAIVDGEYRPYDILDDASKVIVDSKINDGTIQIPGSVQTPYAQLSGNGLIVANNYIEAQIAAETLVVGDAFKDAYHERKEIPISFTWDGALTDGTQATPGQKFTREFTPIYATDAGDTYPGNTTIAHAIQRVESTEDIQGEINQLMLNLSNGESITEDMVMKIIRN